MKQLLKNGIAAAICAVVVILNSFAQEQTNKYPLMEIKQIEGLKKEQIETSGIMEQFNKAFLLHDPSLLVDLVAENCVMESIQGPDGIRYEGYQPCLEFWQNLVQDKNTRFEVEEVFVAGNRATIRWRYFWGQGFTNAVRGVTLIRVRDGKIEEALGYSKTVSSTGLDN
jgi:hypothetical protein